MKTPNLFWIMVGIVFGLMIATSAYLTAIIVSWFLIQ